MPPPFAGERTEASLVDWLESRTIPHNQRFVAQVLEQIGAAVGDVRYADVLEKARARLGALPAVAAGAAGGPAGLLA